MKIPFLNSQISIVDASYAKNLVGTNDTYSELLTSFDLQAKIKSIRCPKTTKDYLSNAQRYLYDWKDYEKLYLKNIIDLTEKQIKKKQYRFDLPDEIFIIKSAMHEEGNANGFTRENYIVLNYNSLSAHLFEHELFHIISRYNSNKIKEAYAILGFKACNEVEVPSTLIDLKITNPDAPFNNYYIKVDYENTTVETIMILYSTRIYEGGNFFSYINKGLMIIEGNEDSKKAVIRNGAPILLGYDEVDKLFDQIGSNTEYNIHQEEITAEHFSMALHDIKDLPNQQLVDNLNQVFIK
ncbi:hypothetical protein [uncultured Psychroserpens sp.]|uniref:hypothetical protein n=1 Tax=uncultured Psychroserpens sp. TaxID=255436 RepID=UPI00262BF037|nr:hypothetical protein [uncultured Psychroserpens sp.]